MSRSPLSGFIAALRRIVAAHPASACVGFAFLAAMLAFVGSLRGGFVGDDFAYVGRFTMLPFSEWPFLFVREWSGGIWGYALPELRPMSALTLMLDARVWGANATGFRTTNLLLHACCAALVGWLGWRSAGRVLWPGVIAGMCFALHPIHAEPVMWITGRVDSVPTVFYLAGFAAWVRWREGGGAGWLGATWIAYAAAAFAKEFGLTLPLMMAAAEILWLRKTTARLGWNTVLPFVGCGVVAGLYAVARRIAMGAGAAPSALPQIGEGSFALQLVQRQWTYLEHLVPPLRAAQSLSLASLASGLAALLLGALVVLAWRRARCNGAGASGAVMHFAFGWHLIATLPLVVTYVSPRHLYLASAGTCIAAALLLHWLLPRRAAVSVGLAAALGLGWLLQTPVRQWQRAAEISAAISEEVRRLQSTLPEGAGLLLDVPSNYHGSYVWAWAAPFALRPPFATEGLVERWVVVTAPDVFRDPGKWSSQEELVQLRVVPEAAVVQVEAAGRIRAWRVDGERVRRAAEQFPFAVGGSTEWQKLVNSLLPPP